MNSHTKHSIALILTVICALMVHIHGMGALAADDDLQFWAPVVLEIPISERITFTNSAEPRLGNNMRDMFQLSPLQPGFLYHFNKHFSAGIAAEYFLAFRPEIVEEYRLRENFYFKHKFLNMPVKHRLRIEQRWIEGSNLSNRIWITNRIEKPLGKGENKGKWYLVGSNSYLVNLNGVHNGPGAGFDQDRLFVGIGRKIKKLGQVETGYQWTYNNRQEPVEDVIFHTIMVQVKLTPFNR